MRFLANISPTLKLTRRLSCNSNVRRYTSLVKVLPCQRFSNNLMLPNIALKRYYCVDKTRKTVNGLTKSPDGVKIKDNVLQVSKINEQAESSNLIMPMALLNLNLPSSKSTKVILIPLNWPETDDKTMGNIISSIFAKRTHLRQIEAFSEALKDVTNSQQISEEKANEELSKELQNSQEIAEFKNNPTTEASLLPVAVNNMDRLDDLAAAVEKALQKCCLQSMQMSVDANILEGTIKGLKFCPVPAEFDCGKAHDLMDFTLKTKNKGKPLSLSSIMQIDASKLNLDEISWNKSNPFPEMHTSSLTNITFPINMIRKSYSTRSTISSQQNTKSPAISGTHYGDEDASFKFKTSQERSNVMDLMPIRRASNVSTSKCNANYDFPFLSNLFGAKELLLSCDAYNKALIEASKRRAALTNCTSELNKVKDVAPSRPIVTSIKGCTAPSVADVKPPQPATQASQGGCKQDDPCKPPQCPNPCKDEMEKLKRKESEDAKAKRNKMPIGCVSPKCKKEDGCTKTKKGPTKKASSATSEMPAVKQADGCKKDDPCKPPECPNPCKDEMEKLQNQKDQEAKRNRSKIPTGCVSPRCKKNDGCSKLKKSPCKKASGTNISSATIQCAKSKGGKDPCKKESECGGGDKGKKKPDKCNKNKKKPADKCKKKEDKCKKKEDPCKKKEDPCKKKEDPCKKKEDPCKKKEDPCKKKEDPCKKKEDPCKKKEDPCKKKEDPCKKKEKKKSPCGSSKKKENPCDKKEKSPCSSPKKKDDPNKKKSCKSDDKPKSKKSDSSASSKQKGKNSSSCGKQQKDTKPNCNKTDKCFSTLAINAFTTPSATTKRTFTSLTYLPTLRNRNMQSFGFMRHFSSKGGKKDKKNIDYGRISQCKSLAPVIPPKRTPAYNPHPKEGLRKCYATYDMDCKKLCKDARKTACRKYAFLKSTDMNKREGKK